MQNDLQLNSFISLAKLRLRDPIRNARDAVKKLEGNFTTDDLNDTAEICISAIKTIGEIATENFIAAQSNGFLQLVGELTHRVVDIARNPKNLKKLGKNEVAEVLYKFIQAIDDVILTVGSEDVKQQWAENFSFDGFMSSLPADKKLKASETQAHAKLFLIKGDLHRYRSNLLSTSYDDALQSYWNAFSLDPSQGIVFNQLGVISSVQNNSDRLSAFFFFFRALYSQTSFQNAKQFLQSKLGDISDKMINGEFAKYLELFKNPSVFDINGTLATSVKNSGAQEYYFSWFNNSKIIPSWKLKLSKLSPQAVSKIQNDHFFHMINLLCTKQSHQTLFATCERFLALTQFLLDEKNISGKQLMQLSTIFTLALKARDDKNSTIVDESFSTVSKTFLYFVGLLFAKAHDCMVSNEEKKDSIEKRDDLNAVLPSLVVIGSYWDSICNLVPAKVYLSPSFTFDFSVIRKKISSFGSILQSYLDNPKDTVDVANNMDKGSESISILPEVILCCFGSRFPASFNRVRISSSTASGSSDEKLLLIRASIVQKLLNKMVSSEYFGLNSSYEYLRGCEDKSTFEIFALTYNKGAQVYAVYPEYLAMDTNAIIDEYEKLLTLTQHGMKFIIPTVVWNELNSISKDRKKDEKIRNSAKNAAELILKTIKNGSNEFQIYNFYAERKYDLEFTPRDLAGLNNKTGREKARDTNDDFILNICRNIDVLLESSSKKGFIDSKITVRNVVLLTEDRILRIKARSESILTCGFSDFFAWFNKSLTSNQK